MGGGFNIIEPSDTKRIHQHPPKVDIFRIHQWLGFFELLNMYDDDLADEFSMELHCREENNATIVIRVIAISLSPETKIRVTTLPLGIRWSKEYKRVSHLGKTSSFQKRSL